MPRSTGFAMPSNTARSDQRRLATRASWCRASSWASSWAGAPYPLRARRPPGPAAPRAARSLTASCMQRRRTRAASSPSDRPLQSSCRPSCRFSNLDSRIALVFSTRGSTASVFSTRGRRSAIVLASRARGDGDRWTLVTLDNRYACFRLCTWHDVKWRLHPTRCCEHAGLVYQ